MWIFGGQVVVKCVANVDSGMSCFGPMDLTQFFEIYFARRATG